MANDWTEQLIDRFPDWNTAEALSRWPGSKSRLAIGQHVRGIVISRAPFGIWLDIAAGHPALLMVREMARDPGQSIGFDDLPEIGATVEACIMALWGRGEISLTQLSKEAPENSAEQPEISAEQIETPTANP